MRLVSLPARRVVCLSLLTLVLIAILLLPQLVTGSAGGNFPTTPGAYQTTSSGSTFNESIVTKLNPQRSDQREVAPSNFDVRLAKDAASSGYVAGVTSRVPSAVLADLASARAAGLARIEADFKAIDVVASPELGTPEVVSVRPGSGFLSGPTTDRVGAMRAFLSTYADAYGLSQQQVGSLELVADYQNPAGNMAWVEFEQRIKGLPVFRGLIRGGFTANGQLARTTGPLAAGLDSSSLPVLPTLNAAQAVSRAAAHVGWDVNEGALVQKAHDGSHVTFARGAMADDAKAWLLYFPLAPGVARLAWATEIWGDPDAFLVLLDAEDGTILFRKNLTNYQSQPATYNVFLNDSPAPMSPSTVLPGSGTQAPFVAPTLLTLIGNEAPNTFNNLGWMTNGANGTNGSTDGNNVQAGIDRDGVDGVDAAVPGVNRVFNFVCNPETDEPLTEACQNAEVTDTFYWTNVYHDRLYLLGFTEAARNFQNDNFGRGGVAADRISAESQDSSGTNNANFSTPPDGNRGRMQMYIFDRPTPDRTSGLDHDVLLHELTHGTSNRLHNNATGLNSTMARGMGEGWSDFYARALLSSADEDPNGIYPTGGWVTYELSTGFHDNYYYGVRRFPYAVNSTVGANGKPHNPLTFADIDPAQINLNDGAFAPNPLFAGGPAFEVHNIGELWCMALLEVRARFITRLGFAIGNERILQFVTDGMKLDPVNPTLLQGRDSIIAAANAGGGTAADIADIRAGFATRGMGVTAQVVNATLGTVVETFDATVPPNTGRLAGHVRHTGTNAAFAHAIVTASPGGRSSTTNEDGSYELYLTVGTYTVTASSGDFVDASSSGVVIADQASTTLDFSLQPSAHLLAQLGGASRANVKLADLDGDGKSEVIVTTTDASFLSGGRIHVLAPSGSELPGWPVTMSERPLNNTAAVADIDGDGHLDIIVQTFGNFSQPFGTDPEKVWAFTATGVLKPGFPVGIGPLGGFFGVGLFTNGSTPSPALADLDGDGVPEIIAISMGFTDPLNRAAVVALKGNGALLFRTILPRSVPGTRFFDEYPQQSVPMIGNLTGDSSPEIVVGVDAPSSTDQGYTSFFALTAQGAFLPGWPVRLGPPVDGSGNDYGALGDLDRDGHEELVVTSRPYVRLNDPPAQLYVFDGLGNVRSGFPKVLPGGSQFSKAVPGPSLADVDHDGFLDIVLVVSDQVNKYLVAYNRFGQQLSLTVLPSGFSNLEYFFLRSVALAEDATGQVCAVFPVSAGQNVAQAQLHAIGLDGQMAPGFPLTLPSLCDSPFCQTASSLSLARDSGSTQVYSVLIDQSGNVRRWEIFDSPRPIPWSQFQRDAANTGLARNPQTLTVTRAGTGTGTVSSSLSGISCGATCAADFNSGTVLALTAFADAGSSFTGWAGDCSGAGACVVTMSQARNVTATFTTLPVSNLQFSTASYNAVEGDFSATINVTRTGDTSGTVTVAFATADVSAQQRTDYETAAGTLTLSAGEVSKTFVVLIVDDVYVEGSETLNLTLSNPTGGAVLGSPSTATLTVIDNDSLSPTTNPLDNSDARFFVRQHYNDFLSRAPDQGGFDFWAGQITQCGTDQTCIRSKRIDVSNAFFYELEYQQTAAYVFRLYRAAFGNNQPFPNPDSSNLNEAKKIPSYTAFSQDRSRLIGSANLAPDQLALANLFVSRPEFLSKYSASLALDQFVDAVIGAINNDDGVDLTSQRAALISLGSRGAVLYRIADDNSQTNPINNRAFIDAEYNRSFVASQYFGYLRRDADIGGFLFWLAQVSSAPLRDTSKQHAMVCSFITSGEYQLRFSSVVTHTNAECQ